MTSSGQDLGTCLEECAGGNKVFPLEEHAYRLATMQSCKKLSFILHSFHNISIDIAGPGVFPGGRPGRQERPLLHGRRMRVDRPRRGGRIVCQAQAAVGRRGAVRRQRLPRVA